MLQGSEAISPHMKPDNASRRVDAGARNVRMKTCRALGLASTSRRMVVIVSSRYVRGEEAEKGYVEADSFYTTSIGSIPRSPRPATDSSR